MKMVTMLPKVVISGFMTVMLFSLGSSSKIGIGISSLFSIAFIALQDFLSGRIMQTEDLGSEHWLKSQ